jgi:pimeloyl-ACP methyl ester carboxylesterase
MGTVISKDGTQIAFTQMGQGPAVILVDGELTYRALGASLALAELLATDFTVYAYDRRGRGESTDTPPYAVQREIEDIEALINGAGGSACVYGVSAGAALALEAAPSLPGIKKLGLSDASFIVDDSRPPRPADFIAQLDALIAANKRGDAVKMFLRTMDDPAFATFLLRFSPAWAKMKGLAHTLPYDFRVLGDTGLGKPLPAGKWAAVTVPTLVINDPNSPTWLRNAAQSLANVLSNAEYRVLEGEPRFKLPTTASLLKEFFQ